MVLQFRAPVLTPRPWLCAGVKYAVYIFLDNTVLFRLFFQLAVFDPKRVFILRELGIFRLELGEVRELPAVARVLP